MLGATPKSTLACIRSCSSCKGPRFLISFARKLLPVGKWPQLNRRLGFRIRGAASASDFLGPVAAYQSFGACVAVLWRGGALGACSDAWLLSCVLGGFWGHVVVFSVRICKIFLFGVGGKSIETYLSAIDDLRPGLLLICPNLSGAVRAVITL